MILNMAELGGSSVLSGAISGKNLLSTLLSKTSAEPATPESVFLDFAWVDVATASFLRESVLSFRNFIRARRSNFYPVIANANDAVLDEFEELVRQRSDALIACDLDKAGKVIRSKTIGELDPKQKMTFDLVLKRGETDAGELMREFGKGENIKHTTAWNNRLSALAALGLVVEVSQGRAKKYKPLFEGI